MSKANGGIMSKASKRAAKANVVIPPALMELEGVSNRVINADPGDVIVWGGANKCAMTLVTVSPEDAELMLARVPDTQRSHSEGTSDRYGVDMDELRWLFDGSPLRYDENGNLNDGQHRAYGLIKSGTEQPFLIIAGLPTKTFNVMDTGKARSHADILNCKTKRRNSKTVSATAAIVGMIESGVLSSGSKTLPKSAINQFVDDHPDLEEACAVVCRTRYKLSGWLRPAILCAVYYFWRKDNKALATELVTKLATGDRDGMKDPSWILREFLMARQRAGTTKSQTLLQVIGALQRAYDLCKEGAPASTQHFAAYFRKKSRAVWVSGAETPSVRSYISRIGGVTVTAKLLGVEVNVVSNWGNGVTNPSLTHFKRLARIADNVEK